MKRRKIKKAAKKLDDWRLKKTTLSSLKLIRYWGNANHRNSKSNMRILTNNFWRHGKFLY